MNSANSSFIKSTLATAMLAALLAACGGGGGGASSGSAPDAGPEVSPPTQVAPAPIDPITGRTAPGTMTDVITGVVHANRVEGTVVRAYGIAADGSNGDLLGTSAATGSDGTFTMTLTSKPIGMVRLIAQGGSFISEADSTVQPIDRLELVTPYVTTELDSFAITPITHMAASAFAHRVKSGDSFKAAYNNAMMQTLTLAGGNPILRGDSRAAVNVLRTVPNSAADTLHAYQDLITGLEWFGVRYDLPSKVVFRMAAANAESGFPNRGVDGDGTPINVGQWIGNLFDETVTVTMDKVMEIPSADPTVTFNEIFRDYVAINIVKELYVDAACKDVAARPALYAHYPDLSDFFELPSASGFCTGAANTVADLNSRVTTNNRTVYMR